uniref:Transmembrane protein 126A n=1 Tax=Salmo trutta TaxID=8032 RepID=A0A674BQD1_SALTR
MSEFSNVVQKGTGCTVPRAVIVQMIAERFERLPELDRKIFTYGPMYLGGNGALVGLIAKSLYRRALNVTQGCFTSNLPMAVLPFLTTVAMYDVAVSKPFIVWWVAIIIYFLQYFYGDLNCPTCVLIRGALVSAVGAGVYPILLALPVNAGLGDVALRLRNVLRFWMNITQPILRNMGAVIVRQVLFGTYLSSRHFNIYLKLLHCPPQVTRYLRIKTVLNKPKMCKVVFLLKSMNCKISVVQFFWGRGYTISSRPSPRQCLQAAQFQKFSLIGLLTN